jgi:hypothetical protein
MSQEQELINKPATVEGKTLVVQEETKRALGSHRLCAVKSACKWKCNCNSSVNKSNRPIQNPLLFVTEPLKRDRASCSVER